MYVPTSALLDRAHAVLVGKSRLYVEDARTFAHALVAIGTGIWTQPAPDIKQVLLEPSEEIERLRRQVRQLTDQLTIRSGTETPAATAARPAPTAEG